MTMTTVTSVPGVFLYVVNVFYYGPWSHDSLRL